MQFWDIVLQQPRFWLGLAASVVVLAVVAYFGLTDAGSAPANSRFTVMADNPPVDPNQVVNPGEPFDDARDVRRKLAITYESWRIPEATTTLVADFVVSNISSYDLKNVTIRCDVYAAGLMYTGQVEAAAPGLVRGHSTVHLDSVRLASGVRAVDRLECRIANYSVVRRPAMPAN